MTRILTPTIGRRALVSSLAVTGAALVLPPSLALAQQQKLTLTPRQSEGPFYPVSWTGDVDNDLVVVKGEAAKALGQVAHVQGRVLDAKGNPSAGARVEIWQCDAKGIYQHPRDERGERRRDAGFQGRGRAVTDAAGKYAFRTIKPVAYPGRTPHIHVRVDRPGAGAQPLITQLYVHGEAQNARDGVLNSIRDSRQRDSVIVRFDPADSLETGALLAIFDILVA